MKNNTRIRITSFIIEMSIVLITTVFIFNDPKNIYAQNYNARELLPKAEIFITPRSGSFLVNSTFESQIYIDTKGNNINAINLRINYDQTKLALINPSGGKSIFGIWVEPPFYDNKRGIAGMAGVITDGITTSSGLIVTMTFKVIAPGPASITISDQTTANLNDGYGSEVLITKGRASYTFNNRPPEGVVIYSETHPSIDTWYNNNSPIFAWDDKQNSDGYSAIFDNIFQTNPDTIINTYEKTFSYVNAKDGIWYLHVRPVYNGIWGSTSTYPVRIDTRPPAVFKIKASDIKDEQGKKQFLVSFFTTDELSGLDHYEVGVISKANFKETSPVFIESSSPYILSPEAGKTSRVIVRAYDKAGNVNEEFIDIYPGLLILQKTQKWGIYILLVLILLLLIEIVLHYLFGHHLIDKFKASYRILKKVMNKSSKDEFKPTIPSLDGSRVYIAPKEDQIKSQPINLPPTQ